MKLGIIMGVVAGLGVTVFAGVASAQEAQPVPPPVTMGEPAQPPPAAPVAAPAPVTTQVTMGTTAPPAPMLAPPPALPDGRANGLMLQARIQAQSSLASLGGGPSFVLGYQGPSYALGLGIGLMRIGASTTQDNLSASVTLIQVMPTGMIDVWHSADGRTHANLIGGIGYGRASGSVTQNSGSTCTISNGIQTCTSTPQDTSAGVSFVPFMLGFGGDYFVSRNFALGTEAGLQGLITTGIDSTSGGTTTSIDGSGNLQIFYAALRATFVMGE